MDKKYRSRLDRRAEEDRRTAYDLEYFLNGGEERRQWVDRRWRKEMRKGWVRINTWVSIDLNASNSEPAVGKP